MAIPANRRPFRYVQPDGSVIYLRMHGDEYSNWVTRESDGAVVVRDSLGYYRKSSGQALTRASVSASHTRGGVKSGTVPSYAIGEHRFLVILVEFSDLKFSVEDVAGEYERQFNGAGYSRNGAVGSARDYFIDNSFGKFSPTFDVYGPVCLPSPYKYYGGDLNGMHDVNSAAGFADACRILDDKLDFSKYDEDGDGTVDNIYFVFAGGSQASGAGEDHIWPHASTFINTDFYLDKKHLGRYACGEELNIMGSEPVMCGIGTFCHEFCHVLGLMDEYDIDYEENGSNDSPLWSYSIMEQGSYNNNGMVPPFMNWMERQTLGWMDGPVAVSESGHLTIPHISKGQVYSIPTGNAGEDFVLECRDGSKWDKGLPAGLLIYHADRSSNAVGQTSAKSLWDNWSINIYGSHPCFYLVPCVNPPLNVSHMPFPGSRGAVDFSPVAWSGENVPIYLNGITYSNSSVECDVEKVNGRYVKGRVFDSAGNPLSGVAIFVNSSPSPVTESDADGFYCIDLSGYSGNDFSLSVSFNGYMMESESFTLQRGRCQIDFYLKKIQEDTSAELKKYNDASGMGIGANTTNYAAGVRFEAQELSSRSGALIEEIDFMVGRVSSRSPKLYVIIEAGATRILTKQVSNPVFGGWNKVEVSHEGISIPRDESVLFGYYIEGCSAADYPLLVDNGPAQPGGDLLDTPLLIDDVRWTSLGEISDMDYNFIIAARVGGSSSAISNAGYNFILDYKGGHYKSGDKFSFKLVVSKFAPVESVVWYFDGVETNSPDVELTPGNHIVEAKLVLADGRKQKLTLELAVE